MLSLSKITNKIDSQTRELVTKLAALQPIEILPTEKAGIGWNRLGDKVESKQHNVELKCMEGQTVLKSITSHIGRDQQLLGGPTWTFTFDKDGSLKTAQYNYQAISLDGNRTASKEVRQAGDGISPFSKLRALAALSKLYASELLRRGGEVPDLREATLPSV